MLTPLAAAETGEDMAVVMRLLKEGDVNVRAAQVRGVRGVCRARVVGRNVPKPKPAELLLIVYDHNGQIPVVPTVGQAGRRARRFGRRKRLWEMFAEGLVKSERVGSAGGGCGMNSACG